MRFGRSKRPSPIPKSLSCRGRGRVARARWCARSWVSGMCACYRTAQGDAARHRVAARLNNVTPHAMQPGAASDAAGALFEAFVSGEVRRQLVWADTGARMFHVRVRDGVEVDLVPETSDRRVAGVEMWAAGSVTAGDFSGLRFLRDTLGSRFTMGFVLYTGRRAVPFGDRIWALSSPDVDLAGEVERARGVLRI